VNWLERLGSSRPLVAQPGYYEVPTLSPDDRRIAFILAGDLWVYDIARETRTRLTVDLDAWRPIWAADSRFIVFTGPDGIWWVRSDGGAAPQLMIKNKHVVFPTSFTADSARLAFQEHNPSARESWNLWTVPVRTDGSTLRAAEPEPFLKTAFDERSLAFSADGRWVAYSSSESGRHEIYVRGFPDDGRKWQVSSNGGMYPEWSRGRPELFFQSLDGLIMAASYSAKGALFTVEKPRVWSTERLDHWELHRNYSVASDGRRVAALVRYIPPGQYPERTVTLVINALDEFGRQVTGSR
jgi:Tol biopolymer transport system component